MISQDTQTIQEHIQLEAYLLSERAGHPAGMDKVFWTQAEAIVHGRGAAVVPAIKPAKRTKKPATPKRKPAATESKAKAAPKRPKK